MLLQLVFRCGDADTYEKMGWLTITRENKEGVVTFEWKVRNKFIEMEKGGGAGWRIVGVYH